MQTIVNAQCKNQDWKQIAKLTAADDFDVQLIP